MTVVGRIGGSPSPSLAAFSAGFAAYNFDLPLPITALSTNSSEAPADSNASNQSAVGLFKGNG